MTRSMPSGSGGAGSGAGTRYAPCGLDTLTSGIGSGSGPA